MTTGKSGLMKTLLICVLIVLFASACGSGNGTTANNAATENGSSAPAPTDTPQEPPKEELPPAELVWYVPMHELQPDIASVEAAVNAYIQPKINATLELKPIVTGDFTQKMNAVASAAETFDLVFTTNNWLFYYEPNVQKGAFTALDDLLQTYASDYVDSIPDFVLEGARSIDGKLYAIPNYQTLANNGGFVIAQEYADKYQLDIGNIRTFKDLEPFLEQIKQNEPDKIPFLATVNSFDAYMYGYDGTGGYYYKEGDPSYTLVDLVFTPEYRDHYTLMHEWFKKGYTNKDAGTANAAEIFKTGKVVASFEHVLKPGGEAELMNRNGGQPVVTIPTWEPVFKGSQGAMTAISKTSKNPERAMMLLNLVNTDPELFNLLAFGIEGKHYEKKSETHIAMKPDGGYVPNVPWTIGNVTIGYLLESQQDDTWTQTIELNESARIPDILGFAFDPEPVKTEQANISAVNKEFITAITTGTVDPAEYIPQYQEALKHAGSEKVLQEMQRQLDEFLKEKGLK